jgi:hypothetical protein
VVPWMMRRYDSEGHQVDAATFLSLLKHNRMGMLFLC